MDFGDEQVSRFNSALAQIQSVQDSFNKCKRYSKKGDFNLWRWELNNLWREISSDSRRKNPDMTKNRDFKVMGVLDKFIDYYMRANDRDKAYKYLSLKEIELRWIWELSGKGSLYEEQDDEL